MNADKKPRKRGRPARSGRFKQPPLQIWYVKRVGGGAAKQLGIVYAENQAKALEEGFKKFNIVTEGERNRIFVELAQ